MPHYEYRCPVCGHVDEVFRMPSRRNDPVACVACGHDAMERTIEVPMAHHTGLPSQGQGVSYEDGSGMSTKTRKTVKTI